MPAYTLCELVFPEEHGKSPCLDQFISGELTNAESLALGLSQIRPSGLV